MSSDNEVLTKFFAVFGKGCLPISPADIDDLVIIGIGKERRVDNKTEIQMEFGPDPGTPGSHFASHLTRALVDDENDVLICYDLTWDDPDIWLSTLRDAGFDIEIQPHHGTGRQLGICAGKGRYLISIDWLSNVYPFDSTFLAMCPKGCAKLKHKIAVSVINDIFSLAINEPEELWDLLGGVGLFSFLGGEEGDFLVFRIRGIGDARLIEALRSVSIELNFSLYYAGDISGWDSSDFLLDTSLEGYQKWYTIPDHWHIMV